MKYLKIVKIILGLLLIPFCAFVGSTIPLGGGNGAIIGGILGVILCCMLFWSRPSWANTSNLEEQHQVNSNVDKEILDKTIRSVQQAAIENEIRRRGIHHQF